MVIKEMINLVGIFDSINQTLTVDYLMQVLVNDFKYSEELSSSLLRRSLYEDGFTYIDKIDDKGKKIFIGLTERGEGLWNAIPMKICPYEKCPYDDKEEL